jgi:hypothetical protein
VGRATECELTTILTTTKTTVGLSDTSSYTTKDVPSCLVAPSARAYGPEGWEFESLRAHHSSEVLSIVVEARLLWGDRRSDTRGQRDPSASRLDFVSTLTVSPRGRQIATVTCVDDGLWWAGRLIERHGEFRRSTGHRRCGAIPRDRARSR